MEDWMKKLIIAGAIFLVVLIAICNSCSVVKEGERGVSYTFGKLSSGVITPGMRWHAPFATKVKKFKIVPRTTAITFSYGSDAAVTSDMQSVGCDVNVIYRYQESGIIKIATEYSDEILKDNITRLTKSSIKSIIGKYSIYDLTSKQTAISNEAKEELISQIEKSNYPVLVDNVVVTNWDWSQEFDRKIQDRMNATENALKAERELKLIEINAQKIVKEAEAKKSAEEKIAEALIIKAEGEAKANVAKAKADAEASLAKAEANAKAKLIEAENDSKAKKLRVDADSYEAQKVKENQESYQKQWDYNIRLERAKNWNGKEVPDAAYVVPGTGAVVPLVSK